ncbi:ABC transporter substrate-binding protein [Jiangella asiatica]|uniref:Extracellular solute-binding protein n=1 Tax=Jiangella asiatica TaxID=2530372 RepID=A0A4R5DQB5_9ACTN|nr:extracellular solute-binding protein [Jiangella asiatica]TDE15837.1 extracellular solute-binding protein [Jiangella asiatica]
MRLRLTIATLGTAGLLAACGGGGGGDDGGSDTAAVAEVTAPATGTIRYESWTPTQETFDAVVAGFAEENPDVEVTSALAPIADYQTSLQTQLRAGGGPDVFVVSPGAMFNQFRQYMEPLDDYAEAAGGDGWAEEYAPEALSRGQVDDATLGLPVGYGVAGFLWVNRTVLAQAGVEVPQTYDDLVAAADALAAQGIAPIALGGKDAWQVTDYYLALAADIDADALYAAMEGSGEWTAPGLVEAFEAWSQLFADGVFQEGAVGAATYNDAYDLFTQGQAAFFANGSWNLDMYANSLDRVGGYDIDAVPFPFGDDGAPITGDVSGIVVVNKASENKGAAYRLAEYLSRGDGSQILMDTFLDFPVTAQAREPSALPEPAAQPRASIVTMIDERLAGYRQVPSPTVAEALGQALVAVAAGSASPDEAAGRVQDAAESA